jgi:DNA-binding winged helix-turn-helix (wHTH) protein
MIMERTGEEYPILIGQTGPLENQRWIIDSVLTIGRDSECDIVIPDRQVSRFHARVTPSELGILVEDLGSKNGTFCNQKLIADPHLLQDGDIIQIALAQGFAFISSDATLPLEIARLPLQGIPESIDSQTGTLRLDLRSRRVWVGEQEIIPSLSRPQFRLLNILFENEGRVVTRQDIISAVWKDQDADGVSEQALDALVRRLRDRIASIDEHHQYILTVRGHGLRLNTHPVLLDESETYSDY